MKHHSCAIRLSHFVVKVEKFRMAWGGFQIVLKFNLSSFTIYLYKFDPMMFSFFVVIL